MPQCEDGRRCISSVNLSVGVGRGLESIPQNRRSCAYAMRYGSLPHHYKTKEVSTKEERQSSSSKLDGEEDIQRIDLNRNIVLNYKSINQRVKANLMKVWFKEFDDLQRNAFLREIVEDCESSQMHTLSLLMEDQLHKDCPPQCKDFLSWLPPHICFRILGYLDPESLARASQVSRLWRELADTDLLWQRLCSIKEWRLSEESESKLTRESLPPSSPAPRSRWKALFAARWRLKRNWLTGRCHIRTFAGHTHAVSCVQMDDTRIVSGSHDKTIKVWDVRTNSPWSVMTLVGHSGTVRCLQLLGGQGSVPRLVSGSSDRTIKVWDLSIQPQWSAIACRATMVGHTDTVRCLQADEEKVISGSYDNTLKVWCMKTGRCLRTLTGHAGRVLTIFYDSSDGTLISGSDDMTIKVWKLDLGSCVDTLEGHTEAVTSLTLTTTDGASERRIISGSLDRTIKVWSLETRQCLSTLDWMNSEGHTGVIRCLQADSWRIISAADDKTLKMWSLDSGNRLVTFRKHEDGVTCVQFNDFMMVSGSYDKTVKLWDFRVC